MGFEPWRLGLKAVAQPLAPPPRPLQKTNIRWNIVLRNLISSLFQAFSKVWNRVLAFQRGFIESFFNSSSIPFISRSRQPHLTHIVSVSDVAPVEMSRAKTFVRSRGLRMAIVLIPGTRSCVTDCLIRNGPKNIILPIRIDIFKLIRRRLVIY